MSPQWTTFREIEEKEAWPWHVRWNQQQKRSRYWFQIQNNMRHATYINFGTSSLQFLQVPNLIAGFLAVRWQQWYWRKWGRAPTSSDKSHEDGELLEA